MARVLVVDDDPDILKIAEKVLQMGKYHVTVARDAVKAMEYLNTYHFDALISDANMPQYSGFDLVQTIKNNRRFDNMAIAMLTGLRERKDIERAIRMGVDDYIVKPLDPLLFLKKVEQLFLKKPPEERPEVHLTSASTLSKAEINLQVQVQSVSEVGLVLNSHVHFTEGSNIQIQTPLFQQIGMEPPPMKVLKCLEQEDGTFMIQVIFVGVNEAVLQKLRAWIYSEATRNRPVRAA